VIAANRKQMGSKATESPYDHLIDNKIKQEVRYTFINEFCTLNKLSLQSPLLKIVKAGSMAIPKLSKLRKIIDE